MEATLDTGEILRIKENGGCLEVYAADASTLLFSVHPPEHAGFYSFARHAVEGECPIISFDPQHTINGWSDWYYKVDIVTKKIERLNPWK